MVKPEDPIVTVKVDTDAVAEKVEAWHAEQAAAQTVREALPLRTFCVELTEKRNDHSARFVNAHVVDFDSGWISLTAPNGPRWVRFYVYRNGGRDIVASFHEDDVTAIWEATEE